MGKKTVPTFHTRSVCVSLGLAFLLSFSGAALGQSSGGSFQLTNSVVAGGGGASNDGANNRFSHDSTVGEHAAGTLLRNPPFSQTAGFRAGNIGLVPTAAPGEISGQVTKADGTPLAGVTVRLNGTQTRLTITDSNGNYNFSEVETNGFYTITPSRVNYTFSPTNRSFSLTGAHTEASFTAAANGDHLNPLDTTEYFVRQQYLDFLNREPDHAGLEYWSNRINQCGEDQSCNRTQRIGVSNAFFFELEFQQTGAYVFRLHRAAFGNNQPGPNPDSSNLAEARSLPSYAVFVSDRARVVGGAGLAQSQLALANILVQRTEFVVKYPTSLDGQSFVDAVLTTIRDDSGVDLSSERIALMTLSNSGGRAAVMYRLADDNVGTNRINNRVFIDQEYNRALVATQYFGYLRRNPDMAGFLFWLGQVNSAPFKDVARQHAMVCSFVTSAEYQQRFSPVVTHTNGECAP